MISTCSHTQNTNISKRNLLSIPRLNHNSCKLVFDRLNITKRHNEIIKDVSILDNKNKTKREYNNNENILHLKQIGQKYNINNPVKINNNKIDSIFMLCKQTRESKKHNKKSYSLSSMTKFYLVNKCIYSQ